MRLLEPLFRKTTTRHSFDWYLEQYAQWKTGGNTYVQPFETTLPRQKAESVGKGFADFVNGGYAGNGVIFGLASVRMRVFSEARFQWQRMRGGRPGDLFGTNDLALLERPWPGGTTGDLLSTMILHADFAGAAFVVRHGDQLVCLRPDWVQIVLRERTVNDIQSGALGWEKVGYEYYHGGVAANKEPVRFAAWEVAMFAPQPDPLATYRGMSWLTPVVREIQSDGAMTSHKLRFMENAATPNLAVSLPKEVTLEQFNAFVDAMDEKHKGFDNAGKTLYTAGGADVTVIGADLKQLDFKVTQGAGETRLAQAAGVPPVVAGLSEGLQGSSLNAGNFGQARRQFADITMSNLWRNVSGSLEVLFRPPADARLWYDGRDIAFLREDQKDEAEIQSTQAQTIKALTEAGFTPDSILEAVQNNDWSILRGKHSGLFSVQLQAPGTQQAEEKKPEPLALPAGRDEPVINVNVDARTSIERGAVQVDAGTNVDARTNVEPIQVRGGDIAVTNDHALQELMERTIEGVEERFEQRGMFELPPPAPPRKVRKDVLRGPDGRITGVLETEVVDG